MERGLANTRTFCALKTVSAMTLVNNLGNQVGVFGVVTKGKDCISQAVDIQVWAPGTALVTWAQVCHVGLGGVPDTH